MVGNFPGSALRAVVSLHCLDQDLSSSQSLEEAVRQVPDDAVRVSAYPSKSVALRLPVPPSSAAAIDSCAIIFRSDSNGEDLEG